MSKVAYPAEKAVPRHKHISYTAIIMQPQNTQNINRRCTPCNNNEHAWDHQIVSKILMSWAHTIAAHVSKRAVYNHSYPYTFLSDRTLAHCIFIVSFWLPWIIARNIINIRDHLKLGCLNWSCTHICFVSFFTSTVIEEEMPLHR